MTKKLKINFILPFVSKSGGIAVVLEHTRYLRGRGHDVRLYYPLLPYGSIQYHVRRGTPRFAAHQARAFLRNLMGCFRAIDWFREPIHAFPLPVIHDWFIRPADATIATSWPTAPDVYGLSPSKGGKFYFIQDYEAWTPPTDEVDRTYRLPLRQITIAPWLSRLMENRFGMQVCAEIHNGIDLSVYSPPASRAWAHPRILMMFHILSNKGSEDGLAALERLHRERPDVPICAFGLFDLPGRWSFVEYHKNPPLSGILELYRSSTIFLSPSRQEGWGLPVMEAMACGCAVVATETGCVPILKDGVNMLTAAPGDVESIYERVRALVDSQELSRRTAEAGLATISRYDWSAPGAQFEDLLQTASLERGRQ